ITRNTSKLARNIFLPALLLGLLITEITPAQAQTQITASAFSKPAVKYLGKENNQLVFQLDFDNTTNEYFNVAIKDEDGNLIYMDRFKDKKFSKKFLVNQSEYGTMKLTFLVSTQNDKQAQVFTVNTNTRVIDDVVVTKL
ncbi:MAG TPA: hypothetical protein VGO09_09475, partial [Flavisolibacter sp.]|nr:hypothetical protein [Flavisolibacter sp.]